MALFGLIPESGFIDPSTIPSGSPIPPYVTPTIPQGQHANSGGIFGWLGSPVNQGGTSDGGLNKLGYLGALLQDAGSEGRGQNVARFMQRTKEADAQQKRDAANKAIRDAYSTGDMNKVRQALVDLSASDPDAVGHIMQALQFGQDSYDTTPIRGADGNAYVIGKSGTTKQLPGLQLPDPKALTPYQQAEIENMKAGRQFQQQQFGETVRHNRASEGAASRGSVPSGYRVAPNGNLEYIPGGPADPVRGAGKKAPTEDQNKNSQLYTRAKQQLSILVGDGKTNKGTFDALASIGSQAGSMVPGTTFFTSGDYQRADGALRDIAASYLYSVSGATATPGEVQNLVMTIRPKIGDSAQTIADKKARLSQMVDSIKLRAQPGIEVSEAPLGDQSASASGWTVKRR